MKTIFKPSLYDNPNKYPHEIESQDSVILMRKTVERINIRVSKKGGKYTHIDPTTRYVHTERKNG